LVGLGVLAIGALVMLFGNRGRAAVTGRR
jgi:hypothetical protein